MGGRRPAPGEEVSEEMQNCAWVIKHPLFSVRVNVPGLSYQPAPSGEAGRAAGRRGAVRAPGSAPGLGTLWGPSHRPLDWMPPPPRHAAFGDWPPRPAQLSAAVTLSLSLPPSAASSPPVSKWPPLSLPSSVCPSRPEGADPCAKLLRDRCGVDGSLARARGCRLPPCHTGPQSRWHVPPAQHCL